MINELNELQHANQVHPDALAEAVAIDRQELMDLLEADSGNARPRLRLLDGGSRRSTRVGYVGAIVVAAAAAIFVAIVPLGGEDLPPALDAVEVADETSNQEPDTATPIDPTTTVPLLTVSEDDTGGLEESDGSQAAADEGTPTVTQPELSESSIISTTSIAEEVASPPPPRSDGPFDRSVDLLTLHYDHSHFDDGHAAVAALEIATSVGLQTHVVAGTYADGYDGHVKDYGPVMQAAWGDQWSDAYTDRPGATTRSVDRWLAALDAGGRVWVAEGGVSDFTANVVREIQRQRPDLDTRTAIHVVQHSTRNEDASTAEDVTFLKANVAYERIDDGNATNDTADLRMQSDEFVAAALAGQHSTSWSAAFEYMEADSLDFSDTVEVLHILGIDTSEVANPTDFAARFMN